MNRSQFQHHIPKFYLRGWTTTVNNIPQRVWVYERGEEPRPSAIRRTGGRNNTYAIARHDGTFDLDEVEQYLGKLENATGRIFPRIFRHHTLKANEKKLMATFLSAMYRRDTYTLDAFTPDRLPEMIENFSKQLDEQATAADASDEVKERYREGARLAIEHIRAHPTSVTAQAILASEPFGEAILEKLNWSFAISPTESFVTSDCPIVFDRFRGIKDPRWGHITFPVSPSILLWMTPWPIFVNTYFEVPDDLAWQMNARIIFNAHRQVYANHRNEHVRKFVDEWIGRGLPRSEAKSATASSLG